MGKNREFLLRLRSGLMVALAVLLVLLVPFSFFFFSSGGAEKIGKKIPLKEGTFDSRDGSLKVIKPGR